MPPVAVTDHAAGELERLLSELVAFATESTTPNEALIRWVADHVEANGGRVTVLAADEGRANLVASFGPIGRGGLMLSGHTDVVPAGTGWATDPYAVSKVGDSLYGRGTADMKGFIAAVIRMTATLNGVDLTRPLHLTLSFDEEIGCVGVRRALEVIVDRDDVRPDVVVVGEPTMMQPRRSHMGKLAFEIVCNSVAAHSSMSHTVPSAIATCARLLATIDDLQRNHRPSGDPEVTFNCGSIVGGGSLNVIAARCSFNFECRHIVDHDPDAVLAPLWAAVE
ncbi:MAG TPA: M20/M25/M40 family metallo-hydrolase, partial [Ilumatobacteraceae bacterium]